MEESKELQGAYKIFRAVIYISILMEFFEYAVSSEMWTTGAAYSVMCMAAQDVAYLSGRKSCLQQDSDLCAYLHYVRGHQEQETFGV